MNCANHPDRERSAFCQICGKPLCTECIRMIGNSVFCEPCYNLRMPGASTAPGSVYPPPSVPSPGLAALLGFIPGVGAMYNGQYAKGIVHLVVFALLVSLSDHNGIFGLFVAGWVAYMVIEAHHTARARRDGTPLPNPFGLNDLAERLGFGRSWPSSASGAGPFASTPPAGPYAGTPVGGAAGYAGGVAGSAAPPPGAGAYTPPWSQAYVPPATHWGAPQEGWTQTPPAYGVPPVPPAVPLSDVDQPVQRRIPTGAIWLIGLGVLFLFGNTGVFWLRALYLGPMVLIGIGVWLFVRRMLATGHGFENDGTPMYAWRLAQATRGSIWLVVVGVVWLLDVFGVLYWHQSWPIFLIVGGLMLFLRRTAMPAGYPPMPGYPPPAAYGYPGQPVAPVPPAAASASPTAIVPVGENTSIEEGR